MSDSPSNNAKSAAQAAQAGTEAAQKAGAAAMQTGIAGAQKAGAAMSSAASESAAHVRSGMEAARSAGTSAVQSGMAGAQRAGEAMTTAASESATQVRAGMETAHEMGRSVMEKGMAGMAEFSKLFSEMKFPGMGGMDVLMAAQRRNMEALSAANRVALEGAQAVARRHMEIMQQTMAEMTDSMRELASPESPQARAAKQAEMMKHGYERAVAHLKELADLIQRSNGEALSMLHHRFTEALDEVKVMAAKNTPGA